MRKVILHVADRGDQNLSDLADRIKDALRYSDNFTANHKLEYTEIEELPIAKLDHDSDFVHITCRICDNIESLPIDEQRHHLSDITIQVWLDDQEGEADRSLMKCGECGGQFVQVWDYKEGKDLEEIEWRYACTSNVIWGSFDYGHVVAKTREEAEAKAKAEITLQLEAINSRLEEIGQRVEIDLDNLEVKRND